MIDLKPGQWRIIRADGTETLIDEKPRLDAIRRSIGAETLCTVILTRHRWEAEIIMLVDDTGANDGRPVNAKATKLYHAVCVPGTTWQICGDVALAFDSDF
jgi:hypothetical protein